MDNEKPNTEMSDQQVRWMLNRIIKQQEREQNKRIRKMKFSDFLKEYKRGEELFNEWTKPQKIEAAHTDRVTSIGGNHSLNTD